MESTSKIKEKEKKALTEGETAIKFKKFPTPYEGDKGRWSSRYEVWRVDTAEKLQKLWQEYNAMVTTHAPIIRRLEFLEINFPKLLEALKP